MRGSAKELFLGRADRSVSKDLSPYYRQIRALKKGKSAPEVDVMREIISQTGATQLAYYWNRYHLQEAKHLSSHPFTPEVAESEVEMLARAVGMEWLLNGKTDWPRPEHVRGVVEKGVVGGIGVEVINTVLHMGSPEEQNQHLGWMIRAGKKLSSQPGGKMIVSALIERLWQGENRKMWKGENGFGFESYCEHMVEEIEELLDDNLTRSERETLGEILTDDVRAHLERVVRSLPPESSLSKACDQVKRSSLQILATRLKTLPVWTIACERHSMDRNTAGLVVDACYESFMASGKPSLQEVLKDAKLLA